MTREQEKAIEKLKELKEYKTTYYGSQWFKVEVCADEEMKNVIDIIVDLIQTQANNIQRMQELLDLSDANNVKKNKIIDEMAKQLYILGFCKEIKCKECTAKEVKECIKQYFEGKIENELSSKSK